jgi:hemin uptake protein HemP
MTAYLDYSSIDSNADAGGPSGVATSQAAGIDFDAPNTLPSSALLRGAKAVDISHNGLVYRLQTTRLGKLILTK